MPPMARSPACGHAWTFDDMSRPYALQGIETKIHGSSIPASKLARSAKDNVRESDRSLASFTSPRRRQEAEMSRSRSTISSNTKDSALTFAFHRWPLEGAVKPKQLALDTFRSLLLHRLQFEDKDPVKLVGAPETCQLKVQRPGEADVKKLTEEMIASGDQSNYGAMYANKIAVTCP
jgi:ABC-type uncharacterized transport system substrate-binding protein